MKLISCLLLLGLVAWAAPAHCDETDLKAKDPMVLEEEHIPYLLGTGFESNLVTFSIKMPSLCQICIKIGRHSKVFKKLDYSTSTASIFIDSEGYRHNHVTHLHKIAFYCERDHWWIETEKKGSCACGWTGEKGFSDSYLLKHIKDTDGALPIEKMKALDSWVGFNEWHAGHHGMMKQPWPCDHPMQCLRLYMEKNQNSLPERPQTDTKAH